MIRYRHKGCTSEVFRYVGQGTPNLANFMHQPAEWQLPDCTHVKQGAQNLPVCPDCGEPVFFGTAWAEPIPEPVEA